MGADDVIDASQEDLARALARLGGPIDVAVEAVGYAPTIRQACAAVRQGGRVVLLGNLEREVSLNVPDLIAREVTLIGSYASAGEYGEAVRLVGSGAVDVRPLISEVLPLSAGQSAFDRLHAGREDLLKIVLVP
jgi:L-iditol 2-dehydrogenase